MTTKSFFKFKRSYKSYRESQLRFDQVRVVADDESKPSGGVPILKVKVRRVVQISIFTPRSKRIVKRVSGGCQFYFTGNRRSKSFARLPIGYEFLLSQGKVVLSSQTFNRIQELAKILGAAQIGNRFMPSRIQDSSSQQRISWIMNLVGLILFHKDH